MKNMIGKAASLITKKLLLWIGGLLGIKGALILSLAFILSVIIIGAVSGSASQSTSDDEFSGGMYTCSPSGGINKSMYDAALSKAGKLSNYGEKIIQLSKEQGIDPVLFAAIAIHETTWGKSNAIISYNNPGGLMGSNGLMRFSSLDEGLESMARTLHNRIIKDGLVTIEKLGSVYAPIGAANDPTNLNANWVPTTTGIVEKLGGLSMNCEPSGDLDFVITDGNASALRKNIATVGMKWVNKTVYVFGGGRTPASIARGDFDCSSFVHWAYKQNGITLGHVSGVSTETLNKMGEKISIKDIQVGDLIFWNTYKHDGHVAIYIGDGKFIGSQSGNKNGSGVAIERLDNSYWKSVFSGHVRRLIKD